MDAQAWFALFMLVFTSAYTFYMISCWRQDYMDGDKFPRKEFYRVLGYDIIITLATVILWWATIDELFKCNF